MRNSLFLFFLLGLTISCKNSKPTQESFNELKDEQKPLATNKKTTKDKEDCFEVKANYLNLPINGGDNLMTSLIENDVEAIEYKCDFLEGLIKKLCNTDSKSLYLLPSNNDINLAILSDECGDNNHYELLTFKNGELVDFITIYQYFEEMSENPKKIIKDFKITKNLELIIQDKEYKGKTVISEKSKKYEIKSSGNIKKIEG